MYKKFKHKSVKNPFTDENLNKLTFWIPATFDVIKVASEQVQPPCTKHCRVSQHLSILQASWSVSWRHINKDLLLSSTSLPWIWTRVFIHWLIVSTFYTMVCNDAFHHVQSLKSTANSLVYRGLLKNLKVVKLRPFNPWYYFVALV